MSNSNQEHPLAADLPPGLMTAIKELDPDFFARYFSEAIAELVPQGTNDTATEESLKEQQKDGYIMEFATMMNIREKFSGDRRDVFDAEVIKRVSLRVIGIDQFQYIRDNFEADVIARIRGRIHLRGSAPTFIHRN